MDRMALTFYCDDTVPYGYPPDTFGRFLDFVESEGIAGESSVLLGAQCARNGMLSRPTTQVQRTYVEQLQRAYDCGVDAHMEIMTHGGLFDFESSCVPDDAMHEGVWLRDPEIPTGDYEAYFSRIVEEGERTGVQFTGLTLPGCGCDACRGHLDRIGRTGFYHNINPNVWQGLLNVAREDAFRARTVSCFIGYEEEQDGPVQTAADGPFGVYDLSPNARDRLGIWLNDSEHVDADYYITADGARGRIPELVRAGTRHCVFYAHWQGLNPHNGVGWEPFTKVVQRVREHLGDEVVWMRPSDIVAQAHAEREGED
jgi:hypothetical protein